MPDSFRPELPARLTFASDVDNIHTSLVFGALAASTVISAEEKQTWSLYDDLENGYEDLVQLHELAVPGDIRGSEQVVVHSIHDDGTEDQGIVKHLFFSLLRDGSPYIPDDDLNDGCTVYQALAFPDGPPIMINGNFVHSDEYVGLPYIQRFMAVKRDRPDKIHMLTDDECKVLISALQNFQVNTDKFESIPGEVA